jgi:peptide/nickel transport system ATP-binding protein
MYISHNLGVVARVATRVGVMYAGEIVERATVTQIYENPLHPYTQGLMRCVPKLGADKASSLLYPIRGRVPPPNNRPVGCVFSARCDYTQDRCRHEKPRLRELSGGALVRCHFAEEIDPSQWTPSQDIIPPGIRAKDSRIRQPILDRQEPDEVLRCSGKFTERRVWIWRETACEGSRERNLRSAIKAQPWVSWVNRAVAKAP